MKFYTKTKSSLTPLAGKVKKFPLIGFTLIEIMVVVGIISILSAILFANFSDARKISRDKVRTTTLKEVQLALEFYKAQNGRYPAAGCSASDTQFAGPGPGTGVFIECPQYIVGLVPDFIAALPVDSAFESELNRGFYYRTNSSGSSYKLMAHNVVEVLIVGDIGDEFARCPSFGGGCSIGQGFYITYAVYSSGAENW